MSSSIKFLEKEVIDPISRELYNAVTKVKCDCSCHSSDSLVMHKMPCCIDGLMDKFIYVEKDN